MKVKIKTDVSSEPLTANGLKAFLNKKEAWSSDESTELGLMIVSARQICEEFVGRSFAQKTLQAWVEAEEVKSYSYIISLSDWPVSSIVSVTPYNSEGDAETALTEGTGYYLQGVAGMNQDIRISQTSSTGETTTISDYLIEYIVGYGAADCGDLPEIFSTAMKTLIAAWWRNRENWVPVISEEIKMSLLTYVETRF